MVTREQESSLADIDCCWYRSRDYLPPEEFMPAARHVYPVSVIEILTPGKNLINCKDRNKRRSGVQSRIGIGKVRGRGGGGGAPHIFLTIFCCCKTPTTIYIVSCVIWSGEPDRRIYNSTPLSILKRPGSAAAVYRLTLRACLLQQREPLRFGALHLGYHRLRNWCCVSPGGVQGLSETT